MQGLEVAKLLILHGLGGFSTVETGKSCRLLKKTARSVPKRDLDA